MTLNDRARVLADTLAERFLTTTVADARVIDCTAGGLDVGLMLSRVCLADLATVELVPATDLPGPAVQVRTDDPVLACLASQYAGWQVTGEKYFAMGSGPMRAVAAREPLFADIPGKEPDAICAVGVLETKKPPPEAVVRDLRAKLGPAGDHLTVLFAPAASLPGTIQVVARSVETALHKLHELKFDVTQVVAGYGTAPLPPVATDELAAIGRTNDAILYGGRVTLWVRADDAVLDALGPKVPSSGSSDHGSLFAELYARYGNFYQIDPLLFSPAEVTFVNLSSGKCRTFGRVEPGLLRKSFLGE